MSRSKSHYKDPNRRSNWFKGESVPPRELNKRRTDRFRDLVSIGETEAEALARALEIIPKSRSK